MKYIVLVLLVLLTQGCVEQQPTKSITQKELTTQSYKELTLVAQSIKDQEKAMNDFETFINIMKNYVSDYSNLIQTSAYFSNALRILPIPYAGEVSNGTKLISNSLVTLNATATALYQYRTSSRTFLQKYNQLGENPTPSALLELANFADTILIIDALKLQNEMEQISKTTEALVSTMQMVSDTSTSALNYLGKAKALFSSDEEIPTKDKELLTKSKDGFKSNLAELNSHINMLKNSAIFNRQVISKAKVISDLAFELDKK